MRIIFLFLSIFAFTQMNAQNYKFGKVSKTELQEKEHPKNKEANAAILYRNQRVYYDLNQQEGISLITEIHERIKIYNKEGFNWATKEIKKYKGKSDKEDLVQLKGYTYNLIDGKVEEEKLRNDEVFDEDYSRYNAITKFTMPAVTEGSVIEYTYKIKSPFLGSIGKTPLQYTIPINKLELEIEIPEFFGFSNYFNLRSPLKFKLENSSKTFSKSFTSVNRQSYSTRGRTKSASQVSKVEYKLNTYVINREDIPALKKEKHLDNLQNYAAYIDWELMYTKFPNSMVENLSTNWDGVAKSIYTDVGLKEELNRSGFYDEDLEAVIAGVSNPVMKIKKIFNFVKQKVSWNDYLGYSPESGVKKAYKEGSGNTADINILLVSMLKYAGVNAHPVLVSTASNGIPLFPTRNGFNYVIAGVELKDQLILLDASDPFSDIGELPGRARNWQGRIIREDGSSDWVNLSPTVHSQLRTQMNVRLSESGISGMHNNIYEGLFAKSFRDHFSTTNEASYIEQLRSGNTGLDVTEFSIENKNSIGKEITEKYDFSLENGVDVIGNKMYLNPLLFESLKENPFKSSERVYPIFFDFPEKRSKTVNILIPDSYKVVTLPESTIVNLSEGGGQFRYIVSHQGSMIRIVSEININRTIFRADEYEFLKKFYDNIIKKQGEAIVLEKEIEDGLEERAASGR